jgi:hypothetical protein
VFSAILILVLWLFWLEFDLFASILLALYSSVFVLLSLFILYFNRYWGKLSANDIAYGSSSSVDFITIITIVLLPFGLFFFDGFIVIGGSPVYNNYSWILKLVSYDYYALAGDNSSMSAALMHNILYKLYTIEIFFFNVYLFFGLVFSVGLLYIFKIWLNPAVIGNIFSLMRFKFYFFFPANFRVRVMNKFRRQSRRKNTSHIKYRVFTK